VRQGTGELKAADLHKFLVTAAYNLEQLADKAWQNQFHCRTLKKAYEAKKNRVEADDFALANSFFTSEFPGMDDKPRSSALAGVMNTLHVFATGMVKWMLADDTQVTPAVLDDGISLFIDFPYASTGPTGKFIAGAWKYATQRHILRRRWDKRFFKVIWMDEFQASATSFDCKYLEQCRSHGGCMVALTQTINSEHMHMSKPEASQLLGNFGTHIFHLSDIDTSKFASDLLGMQRESFVSYSPSQYEAPKDGMFGGGRPGGTLSESYQPVLQPGYFMSDLLCGGPPHFIVDGVVVQLGQRFKNGHNYQRVSFLQGGR
jgi:type IV secretory pathway TraG/TraD family ATPase VirD4